MPSNPRSRRTRIPRRLPPRPTIGPAAATPGSEYAQPRTRAQAERYSRSSRLIERETPYVLRELRRVAAVSTVTFGLLIALAIIERFR